MRISKLNQFNYTDNTSAGFTLIELLVSISIMGIVSALVGTGITFMVSSNQKLAAAQSRRVEVSQALDVISYDIRRAGNVNGIQNPTPAADIAAAIDVSIANSPADGEGPLSYGTGLLLDRSSYIPVLFLKIPLVCNGNRVVNERVIYSTKRKEDRDGRVGPNILYRYGRIADENDSILCSYNATTNTVVIEAPVNVPIADNITPATTPPTCGAPAGTAAPAATPAPTETKYGFYTCVSDRQVSIALFAKLSDPLIYGDNRTITSGSMASVATGTGTNTTTSTAIVNCEVPNLISINPSNAKTTIDGALLYTGMSSPTPPTLPTRTYGAATGLSSSGIPITTGGSTVISQTPSAGSLIPCSTGLVTYTY